MSEPSVGADIHPAGDRPMRGQETWPWPMQMERWNRESCIKVVLTVKDREVTARRRTFKALLEDILEVTRN